MHYFIGAGKLLVQLVFVSELFRATYAPWDGVCVQKMREHPGHVTQLVGLKAMDGFILFLEDGLKAFHVVLLQQAEPLKMAKGALYTRIRVHPQIAIEHNGSCKADTNTLLVSAYPGKEPKELLIGPLLRTAVQDHVAQLFLWERTDSREVELYAEAEMRAGGATVPPE